MRLTAAKAFLALVAITCGALASCTEPKVANRCAGSSGSHCITSEVCSFDHERGCEVCTCDSPFPASTAAPAGPPVR